MSARSQPSPRENVNGLHLAQSLRDCLTSGVLVISRREQIVSCNSEAEKLLNLPPGKSLLAPATLLPAALQNLIREVIAGKKPITHGQLKLSAANSVTRTFHVNLVPVQSQADSPDVVVVLSDISSFAQLEANVTRLDRLSTIGTLSATMAHEIKNALVAVKTFVELLLEKNRDSELSDVVSREMKRMESIVGQMLRFGGPARPSFSTVRLHDVLEQSLRMVQHKLDGKLISLTRSFNATPDAIHGDDYQLEQAFVNLFLNAAEATGTNGSLTVSTEVVAAVSKAAPHVRVMVKDSGIGITPEHLQKMFEPFFTTKHHGTGLGLPITQRIIQEHSGEITVESEPDKGTTFFIKIPVAQRA